MLPLPPRWAVPWSAHHCGWTRHGRETPRGAPRAQPPMEQWHWPVADHRTQFPPGAGRAGARRRAGPVLLPEEVWLGACPRCSECARLPVRPRSARPSVPVSSPVLPTPSLGGGSQTAGEGCVGK